MEDNVQAQAEANKRLDELRRAFARYRTERQRTHQVIMRSGKLPPKEAAQRAHAMRDPEAEQKAAQALVDVNRVLLGRDPSEAELEVGVPGMGVGPLVLVPVLIGGAWTATSLFNYLSERESRIQRELDPTSVLGYGPASLRWMLPAGVGAAVLVGGYLWVRSLGKKGKKKKAAVVPKSKKELAKKNPWSPPWLNDEDSDDDSGDETVDDTSEQEEGEEE